ncbi:MAG: anthranilate synthase component I family protein, partial [Pseudomonadota bacterium]|nr:anthranilate synthase component I family protein [Pseudomonadota bacterium]
MSTHTQANTPGPQPFTLPRKPHYVTLAADCDFFALFQKIERRFDTCYMLESLGEDSHMARHSIIGFDPEYTLYANGNTLSIENRNGDANHYPSDNPYELLRSLIPQNIISR